MLNVSFYLAPRLSHADAIELRSNVSLACLAAQHTGVNVLVIAQEIATLAIDELKTVAQNEVSYAGALHQQIIVKDMSPMFFYTISMSRGIAR